MRKIKRIILTCLLVLSLFFICACQKQAKSFVCQFYIDDELKSEVTVTEGELVTALEVTKKESAVFDGWYIDGEYAVKYDFSAKVESDLYLYGRYLNGYYVVSFETNGGSTIDDQVVKRREKAIEPTAPTKAKYIFDGWYAEESLQTLYDFNRQVNHDFTLYAKWVEDESDIATINYICGENVFASKNIMYDSFMGDFYDFMIDKGVDMQEIHSKKEFLKICKLWEYDGKSDLYHVGNRYGKYFVTTDVDGVASDQPTTVFIGYCYQNGKYIDLIDHLVTFFAYWRTDEGYTNEENHGNDFFYDSWASMVDTSKFFYFTSETLQTKYAWYTSARVKDALDNIVGCGVATHEVVRKTTEGFDLEDLTIYGYTFEGFYLDAEFTQKITKVTDEMVNANRGSTINIYVKVTRNN